MVGLACAGLVLGWQCLTVPLQLPGQLERAVLYRVEAPHAAAGGVSRAPTCLMGASDDGQFYRYIAHDPFLKRTCGSGWTRRPAFGTGES